MALITDAVPCVRIVPRTNQRDYVTIRSDDPGCSAHFGNMGGVHIMNLDRGCVVRAHIELFRPLNIEILHAELVVGGGGMGTQ